MSRAEYERFTFDWLDGCIDALTHRLLVGQHSRRHRRRDCGAPQASWTHHDQLVRVAFPVWSKSRFLVHHEQSARSVFRQRSRPTHLESEHIMELSDRASVYADPRTMAKDQNKGLSASHGCLVRKVLGRIQGNNKERRHQHHNQIPEVYLERVILACSNEGDLVLDPFLGSGAPARWPKLGEDDRSVLNTRPSTQRAAWERIQNGMVQGLPQPQPKKLHQSTPPVGLNRHQHLQQRDHWLLQSVLRSGRSARILAIFMAAVPSPYGLFASLACTRNALIGLATRQTEWPKDRLGPTTR